MNCMNLFGDNLNYLENIIILIENHVWIGTSDHAAKVNLAQYIKGHNWVTLGVVEHVAALKKWICFPFSSELFIPLKQRRGSGNDFPAKIDIAISMLKSVKEYVPISSITLISRCALCQKEASSMVHQSESDNDHPASNRRCIVFTD